MSSAFWTDTRFCPFALLVRATCIWSMGRWWNDTEVGKQTYSEKPVQFPLCLPPGTWMSVSCDFCVFPGKVSETGRSLVQRSPTDPTVVRHCVWYRNLKNKAVLARVGLLGQRRRRKRRRIPLSTTNLGGAVGWGSVLQARLNPLEFFTDNPSGRTLALGSIQPLKMSTRDLPKGKGGRYVWLRTLPPSCAESLEILEASIFWSPKGLSGPVMG